MNIQQHLKEVIDGNRVVLFMKGTPDFPQCGFSGRTAQILKACDTRFASVDVLADDAVRQGIKDFSNWPTVPQLYVGGKFIGGCDIMTQLYESGELQNILREDSAAES